MADSLDAQRRTRSRPADGSPLVTVVVPLFNDVRHISDALRSVMAQSYTNLEVIVVDDGSTDASVDVATKLIARDDRFRLIRHLKNTGLSAARNTGLMAAEGRYITFLDSDDFLFPHSIADRVGTLRNIANERVAGVFCGVVPVPEHANLLFVPSSLDFSAQRVSLLNAGGECPFNSHAGMFRTDILRTMGGFDETFLHGAEDWDFWQRLLRHGYLFDPSPRIGAAYRQKAGSMVRTMPAAHVETGMRLLERAYAPMDEDQVVPNTPHVFRESLGDVTRDVTLTKRMIYYLPLAYMKSSEEYGRVLDRLDGELLVYGFTDQAIGQMIGAGLHRALATGGEMSDEYATVFRNAVRRMMTDLRRKMAAPAKSSDQPVFVSRTLLAACTRKQAIVMADIAKELAARDIRASLLSLETLAGDQGVEAYWIGQGLPFTRLSTALLQWRQRDARTNLVFMRPFDRQLSALAALCSGSIVEVTDDGAPYQVVDGSPTIVPHASIDVAALPEGASALALQFAERSEGANDPDMVFPFVSRTDRDDMPPYASDTHELAALKDKYSGKRCFILGNGPSLNQTDLDQLGNEFTFAVNGIFHKNLPFDPTFYVVEDTAFMDENLEPIRAMKADYKLFPTIYRQKLGQDAGVSAFFAMNRGFYEKTSPYFCVPRFSFDAAKQVFCGQSVTHINLQLAHYFGFDEVYLVGMDFSYEIPSSAKRKGDIIVSTQADPNHFHPDYFGPGRTWKDPKLDRVKLNYQLARDVFAASGRRIFNASVGGKLDVFPRVDFDALFEGTAKPHAGSRN